MAKTLTDSEVQELRTLIDAVDRKLASSNMQTLARAAIGTRVSATNSVRWIVDQELLHLRRIRQLLGLPLQRPGADGRTVKTDLPTADKAVTSEPALREQLVKKGIEPDSYRNVRRVREKRQAAKKTT